MFRRYAIAFRSLVSLCFIRVETGPTYWWEHGVTRVISFAVAVKMKPRHVVISTEFWIFFPPQSLFKTESRHFCTGSFSSAGNLPAFISIQVSGCSLSVVFDTVVTYVHNISGVNYTPGVWFLAVMPKNLLPFNSDISSDIWVVTR
jgi:hypothetical protein